MNNIIFVENESNKFSIFIFITQPYTVDFAKLLTIYFPTAIEIINVSQIKTILIQQQK